MTIAERKAREEQDKLNPWRPMDQAKPDGLICDLLFDDMAGHHSPDGTHYFLAVSGDWYRIEPPAKIFLKPMNWRPAWVRLTPERQRVLRRRADV